MFRYQHLATESILPGTWFATLSENLQTLLVDIYVVTKRGKDCLAVR